MGSIQGVIIHIVTVNPQYPRGHRVVTVSSLIHRQGRRRSFGRHCESSRRRRREILSSSTQALRSSPRSWWMCVYVRTDVRIGVCLDICIDIYPDMGTGMCTDTCTDACTCVFIDMSSYLQIKICTDTCIDICTTYVSCT